MARSGPSRIVLAVRSLLFMGGLGASLASYSLFTNRRDASLALGPQSSAQEAFFVQAADQPDIKIFYRKFTDSQKVAIATNIGRYQDPELGKLCAILLGDFSEGARKALTRSLIKIARVHPEAVAAQLSLTGSFEQFGVREALRSIGASAIPKIVGGLSFAAIRPNAEDLLVSEGTVTVPYLLPLLDSTDPSIQISAVNVLGKLRAEGAIQKTIALFDKAQGKDRQPFLTAIASIGNPRSETLLSKVLADPANDPYLRTQAAFGLGRIASGSSVAVLWKFAGSNDSTISQGCLSALVLCKDAALVKDGETEAARLSVAREISSATADQVVREDLKNPILYLNALEAAVDRPKLVPDLDRLLSTPAGQKNGDLVDLAVKALMSTDDGNRTVTKFEKNPDLSGLIDRRRILKANNLN